MMVIETSEALKKAVAEGLGCSITPNAASNLRNKRIRWPMLGLQVLR